MNEAKEQNMLGLFIIFSYLLWKDYIVLNFINICKKF